MAKRLKQLKINEVSSVDRGAGEGVTVVMHKRDFSGKERSKLADSGKALPDGSFPIVNGQDLENAIQAIGRAKDPAKAKAHIKSRARALGMTDKLPESWGKRDGAEDMQDQVDKAFDALFESVATIVMDDNVDKGASLEQTFEQAKNYFGKIVAADATPTVAKGDTMSDELKKQLDELTAKLAEKDAEIAALKAAKPADGKDGENDGDEDDMKKIDKSALPAAVRKALEAAEANEARLDILEKRNALIENTKIAKSYGLAEGMGETVMKAFNGDKEAVGKLLEVIKTQGEQLKTSSIFKEFGHAGEKAGSAYDMLMSKAEELRKSDPNLTEAKAFAKVYETNRELREQYKREKNGAM